jgi:mono/diheme cytochrome c family protein
VLFALSAAQKTGLGLMAAGFIAFALASSFWFPRFRPDFPGRWLRLFVVASIVLTIGMLATVIAVAKEKEPGEHRAAPGATTPQPGPPPATPPSPAPTSKGNAANGKTLFASQGCASCHTYAPAGATGKVGPNLAHLPTDAQKAGKPLDAYIHESITDPTAYTVPGFPAGVMPPFHLSASQLDDLTAFLTQKS